MKLELFWKIWEGWLPNSNSQTEILQVYSPASHDVAFAPTHFSVWKFLADEKLLVTKRILIGKWKIHRTPSLPYASSMESHAQRWLLEKEQLFPGISHFTNPRQACCGGTDMVEPGLTDGQGKERQKQTRMIMILDTHMESLFHRWSGGREIYLQERRSCPGLEKTICECERPLPTHGGQNKGYWPVDNTEKNNSESNFSKNYYWGGVCGNEAMAKPPSFTEFFAQIIWGYSEKQSCFRREDYSTGPDINQLFDLGGLISPPGTCESTFVD